MVADERALWVAETILRCKMSRSFAADNFFNFQSDDL